MKKNLKEKNVTILNQKDLRIIKGGIESGPTPRSLPKGNCKLIESNQSRGM